MDISYDGGEMPIYTYPGSESSGYDQSFDKTEDHKTTGEVPGEPPQESRIEDIDSSKDQIIEGHQAVDEFQYRSNGYISKT